MRQRIHPRRTDGKKTEYRRANALAWLFSICVALIVLALLFLVWLRPVRTAGESMEPALSDGDVVLIDQLAQYWKMPVRGDLVCFRDENGTFIKRIVALPGETVDIKDGCVYIDACPLDESAYLQNPVGDMDPVTVPENNVFVLGDNRALMYDSRLSSVGCIPYEDLTGVLRARVYPFLRFTIFF